MGRGFICFLAFSILPIEVAAAQTPDCSQVLMKWASSQGFRLQTSAGSELYCRDQIFVGSRIPYNQCGTAAELVSYAREVTNDRVYWTCNEYRR